MNLPNGKLSTVNKHLIYFLSSSEMTDALMFTLTSLLIATANNKKGSGHESTFSTTSVFIRRCRRGSA